MNISLWLESISSQLSPLTQLKSEATCMYFFLLIQAEFVFDDICNTLSDPPSSCKKYIDTVIHESFVSIEWPTLVLVVALGIFIFSLIVLLQ